MQFAGIGIHDEAADLDVVGNQRVVTDGIYRFANRILYGVETKPAISRNQYRSISLD